MTGPYRLSDPNEDAPAVQPEPGTPVVPGTDDPADPTTGQPLDPGTEEEPVEEENSEEDAA